MNEFYHVYNRGVEKRKIFMDDVDYRRFIHDLYEFNDRSQVSKFGSSTSAAKQRKFLINLHCFCLMPNHFHLIVEQLADNSISMYMQKLGTGYTNYFNNKYHRVGPLFQGSFKKIRIEKDEYLLHLSRYLHINPIELVETNWKEEGIRDWKKVNEFLKSYRWSSYLDYIGIKNFPSVSNREFINIHFQNTKDYEEFVTAFQPDDLPKIKNLVTMEVRLP